MSNVKYPYHFCFSSYGVNVRISSNSAEVFGCASAAARTALIGNLEKIGYTDETQVFELPVEANGKISIIQDGVTMIAKEDSTFRFWKYFDSLVRILVADHSPHLVFIHAGVVGWRGKAIILPGDSFFGKTTFVSELARCGAEYYSDEYAIIDERGLVHPFARPLTMRGKGNDVCETPTEIEQIGGKKGGEPIPVGCVFFTKFDPESRPDYQFVTIGQGIVEIIRQTIAIRRNTEFAIKVLKNAFSNAIIVKSPRTEAEVFAREFLEFVDNTAI
jgi:hypothetical protein